MPIRVNAILTEESVRCMDEIRAVKQRLCTKPLTRPDIMRMALDEFIARELEGVPSDYNPRIGENLKEKE